MTHRIEDYALIGDTRTGALVCRNGSIDWLCVPRFDSPACFAALLGDPDNGQWIVAPQDAPRAANRRYVDDTLVLETTFETDAGSVRLTDFMAITPDDDSIDLVRIATGLRGAVPMHFEARFRFEYGSVIPWVRRREHGLTAIAGPDALRLVTPLELEGKDWSTVADFTLKEGQTVPMVLTWHRSYDVPPPPRDPTTMLHDTLRWWRGWSSSCEAPAEWRDAVVRSAVTLKALTHADTGGIVAAATTSLPEWPGGVRNWDYRYCWLRDATFTLYALMMTGYTDEARAWREWLVRAVAGEPTKLQIMYGLAGERSLEEREIPWLTGFAESRPVRIGNAAHQQKQLDVFGEIMDAFHSGRTHGLDPSDEAWRIQLELIGEVEEHWRDGGSGIWEQRAPDRRYVYSNVMAWVAIDRAVRAVERFGMKGPLNTWKKLRQTMHDEICREGFSEERNAFVQYFGGKTLDASALLIPLVGFLPPDDPRIVGTVDAINRELVDDGFVRRYATGDGSDGLPHGEGAFVACSFWLADNLAMMGRTSEARTLFERILDTRNDVGLLAEEYDPVGKYQLGNFPQAFSHVGIINTACNLAKGAGPAERRANPHRN